MHRGERVQGDKGALMQGQQGATEREGVPAAGGVQGGDTAPCPAARGWQGLWVHGQGTQQPAGRQLGLTGPAEHPGLVGENGAATCLFRVWCLERDSQGLLSLSVEALLWAEVWSSGICRADFQGDSDFQGVVLGGISCCSGLTQCCNPTCAC